MGATVDWLESRNAGIEFTRQGESLPPWRVEEIAGGCVVKDANGQFLD
jgi:hypothetical protein